MDFLSFTPGLSHLSFAVPPGLPPWVITARLPALVAAALKSLGEGYIISGELARHTTATIEPGASIKGPAIIGPRCFIASTALLRGGILLDQDCIVGPSCELKTSVMLRGSKLAHLNFVGDSILGEGVNIEAGAMLANYRNELADKRIRIETAQGVIDTGVDKFGSLLGDHSRVGANAVIAPGALLPQHTIVRRLQLIDQYPSGPR